MATERLQGGSAYLAFPFRMTPDGGATSGRIAHIREQIAQVLLTAPGERVFTEFGLGANRLLYLPMTPDLWARVETTLLAGLSEVLRGEASPGSIRVSAGAAEGQDNLLEIRVSYTLSALNKREEITVPVATGPLMPLGGAYQDSGEG